MEKWTRKCIILWFRIFNVPDNYCPLTRLGFGQWLLVDFVVIVFGRNLNCVYHIPPISYTPKFNMILYFYLTILLYEYRLFNLCRLSIFTKISKLTKLSSTIEGGLQFRNSFVDSKIRFWTFLIWDLSRGRLKNSNKMSGIFLWSPIWLFPFQWTQISSLSPTT